MLRLFIERTVQYLTHLEQPYYGKEFPGELRATEILRRNSDFDFERS